MRVGKCAAATTLHVTVDLESPWRSRRSLHGAGTRMVNVTRLDVTVDGGGGIGRTAEWHGTADAGKPGHEWHGGVAVDSIPAEVLRNVEAVCAYHLQMHAAELGQAARALLGVS